MALSSPPRREDSPQQANTEDARRTPRPLEAGPGRLARVVAAARAALRQHLPYLVADQRRLIIAPA